MKVEYLYNIIAIYNEKTIKGAAKERGVSESAFKKNIEIMQDDIGEKLYNVKGPSIELTDEGISLYLYAVKALAGVNGYKNKHLEKQYNKEISIGIDINVFIGYIYICSKFVGDKFNVNFNILQLYKDNILEGVRDGKYDAGLMIMDSLTKEKADRYNIAYKEVCTRRPVVIVSKNHPLAKLDEISLMDLESYKRISLKNSFEEFYCFEHDIEIKYGLKRSNVVFKYISDILMALRNSEFYFIGGINEDEEILLRGLKVIEILELKERVEVGYVHCKTRPLIDPIKAIVDIRETFKTTRK